MRTYVGITGLIFALMFAVHIARILAEGSALMRNPIIMMTSALSLVFAIWAVILLSRHRSGRV